MSKITYTNEVVDAYSGQLNCEAGIYIDGKIIGVVEYVLYNGELSISDIVVRPEFRRQGYASRLMKYIKQENPEYHYVPSLKTPEGASFVHKDLPLDESAQFVYENLEFERGKDPKMAIGVGMKSIMLKKYENLVNNKISHNINWRGLIQHNLAEEILKAIPDRFKDAEGNPKNFGWRILDQPIEANLFSRKELERFYEIINRYWNEVFKANESLDFERGKDPKKSMGIGKYHKYFGMSPDEVSRIIIKEVREYIDPMIDELFDLTRKKGYDGWDDYSASIWDEETDEPLPEKEDPDIQNYMWGIFQKAEEFIKEKYPIKKPYRGPEYQTPLSSVSSEIVGSQLDDGPPGGTMIRQISSEIDASLLESLDFERGKDPKEAMKIGRKVSIMGADGRSIEKGLVLGEISPMEIQTFWPEYSIAHDRVFKVETIVNGEKRIIYAAKFDIPFGIYWGIELRPQNESLEFERGQDPKQSIGLGVKEQIRKEINQDWYPDRYGSYKWNGNYDTALTWASEKGRLDLVKWLVSQGADIRNNHDEPIKQAAAFGQTDVVLWLIDHGADPLAGNGYPILAAKGAGFPELADLIRLKAGEVKESINFERGKDPKEAMDIGMSRQLKERIFTIGSPYFSNINARLKIREFFGGIPYDQIYFLAEDHSALEKRPEKLVKLMEESIPIETKIGFYYIRLWSTRKGKLLSAGEGWGSYLYGDKEMALYYLGQNESLEFERGRDPMDTLEMGRIVKVNGDRGYGEYSVRLLERYYGSDLLEGEEIWKARNIKNGNIVYVVKYSNFKSDIKGVWGEIDAFIKENI